MNLLDNALHYLARGKSVIPIGRDPKTEQNKRPLVAWQKYQKRLPTKEEVRSWFSGTGITGVGMITGAISGIVVLDVEAGADLSGKELPPTVVAKTGGGGWHYYFNLPKDRIIKNSVKKVGEKMDIRAEGGYVVTPPSLHHSGNHYEWVAGMAPGEIEIADMPQWLCERIFYTVPPKKILREVIKGVPEGERNDSATALVGKLLAHIPPEEWEALGWEYLVGWNRLNKPPLHSTELRSVFDSITKRELGKRSGVSIEDPLQIVSLGELLQTEFPEEMWRVENILPVAGKGIVSGVAGVGKSWFLAELARCVALGIPFLGKFAVTQTNVLILDEDMGFRELQRRWRKLPDLGKLHNHIFFLSLADIRLDSDGAIARIEKAAEDNQIGFIIIDPLIGAHTHDENDAVQMRIFFNRFKNFKPKNISLLFAHHHRKQQVNAKKNLLEGMRGSSGIPADIESALAMEESQDSWIVTQTKNRNSPKIKPFKVRMIEQEGLVTMTHEGEQDPKKLKKEQAKELILDLLKDEPSLSTPDIKAKLRESGVGKSNIEDALAEMVDDGDLTKSEGEKGNTNFYALAGINP